MPLSIDELRQSLTDVEAFNVERVESVGNVDKIGEAICAFANDLPGSGRGGVLLIGARDDGTCAGLQITDQMLQTLLDFRDGRIVPRPSLTVRRVAVDGCDLAVVEVLPADDPPVSYKGRVCVRRGPRRDFATKEDERRLVERRRSGNLPFDLQAVPGARVDDLDLDRFVREYLPSAISPAALEQNDRTIVERLSALRFLARTGAPTYASILVIGRDPRDWVPGAYVQFTRHDGPDITDPIKSQKELSGTIGDQIRMLDELVEANIQTALSLEGGRHEPVPDYPVVALQQIVRNALMHRNYEATATPVRFIWYADRVEIISPGGPFGTVTAENFGRPGITDYRNPAIAEALKNLGYVERFGIGIALARRAMAANGNPDLEFQTTDSFVLAVLRGRR